MYWIAGRGDEWVESAPGAHLAYVSEQNDRLGKKVKPLVRLLKALGYNVSAPISSFYPEMRTAEYAAGETVIIYDIDLRCVMEAIVAASARDMNDPARIVGRIPACASGDKRPSTLSMLRTAITPTQDRRSSENGWRPQHVLAGHAERLRERLPVADLVTAGILALLAAIVFGVLTFMKPDRTAEQHLAAGRQLAALRVHARQVLNLDLPSAPPGAVRKTIEDIEEEGRHQRWRTWHPRQRLQSRQGEDRKGHL